MASVGRRDPAEQDLRWGFIVLGCPKCGLTVLVLGAAGAGVWCGACPETPRLEATAT